MDEKKPCNCPLCNSEFIPDGELTAVEYLHKGILKVYKEMQAKHNLFAYGEVKETGHTEIISGINCNVVKIKFPDEDGDSDKTQWKWYTAYRFTVPGWPECTITGKSAAERVIRGRTNPAVLNTLGIDTSAINPPISTQGKDGKYKGLPCPRCGEERMSPKLTRNALSRQADIYICDVCGMDEAIRAMDNRVMPTGEWWIVTEILPTNGGDSV